MTLSGSNLKLDLEMVMLPQIPRIREGSGNLMGQVFLENLTLFLEMGNLFLVKMGVLSGAKMGPKKWSLVTIFLSFYFILFIDFLCFILF